jgi:hypothetical protein
MSRFQRSNIRHILIGAFISFWAFPSCSVQSYLKDDQVYLKKYIIEEIDTGTFNVPASNEIAVKSDKITPLKLKEIKNFLKPSLNRNFLGGWPIRTQLYLITQQWPANNLLQKINKRYGAPPVLHDSSNLANNEDNLLRFLHAEGYLDAAVSTSTKRTNTGMKEIYSIRKGTPYRIGMITFTNLSPEIQNALEGIVDQKSLESKYSGQIFKASDLGEIRSEISRSLREQGFFRFSTDFLEFEADSGRLPYTIDLSLKVLKPSLDHYHKKYKYRQWNLYVGHSPPSFNNFRFPRVIDSIPWLGFSNSGDPINQKLLLNQIENLKEPLFNEKSLRRTLSNFARLGLYDPGSYNIVVNDTAQELNVLLALKPLPNWQFRTEYEFSTNTIALFGINGNISFTRRNALRLGDQLEFRATLGAESQQLTGSSASSSGLNTLDIGLRAQLSIPGILAPGFFQQWKLNGEERTLVSFTYQSQKRQDFGRNVLKTGLGISGLVHGRTQYQIWPLEITYANTGSISESLQKILDGLNDPLLRANFVSYFSTGVRGSWIQDRIRESKRDYLGLNLESSGNFYTLLKAGSRNQNLTDTIWGLPYFRFLKLDVEWRKHMLGKGESLVATRALGSVGLPFGDQKTLPLEKRTFGGGTNSLRAWPIRGLGPGSLSNYANGRLIQFGEIRLEANLEWRFKVVGPLKAALFMDAGNIWTLNDTAYNGLGNFTGKRFINEIALNQGLGLRYDFGFFVMRVDFALKVRDPALAHGKRWVIGNWFDPDWKYDQWRFEVQGDQPSLNQNGVSPVYPLFSTVFGINYPF